MPKDADSMRDPESQPDVGAQPGRLAVEGKAAEFNWTVSTRNPLHKICRSLGEMTVPEYVDAVAQGVPSALVELLAETTGISVRALLAMLGISRTTVYRHTLKGGDAHLPHFEGDAVADFARLVGEAQMRAGQGKLALRSAGHSLGAWLQSPNAQLAGLAPTAMMKAGMGRAHVLMLQKRTSLRTSG